MDTRRPTFREALLFWLKLGFISFGGPAGQIAIMHTELVDRKKWIGEQQFLRALNFCMLLPGPEATQLAIYSGWLLHRAWGGIVAGVLFVLPATVLLWLLSYVYVVHGTVPWIAAIFYGLKPAVTAIVAAAVIKIGRRALHGAVAWAMAALAFVSLYFLQLPFPVIVAVAALIGFIRATTSQKGSAVAATDAQTVLSGAAPTWTRAFQVLLVSLVLWFAPILVAGFAQGWSGTLVREGVFFSKAAMVTFGGAYAVLPYVAQQAVETHHWLIAPQMVDGLALAETTPGPLIMVVQFVGFLGGWNQPGTMSPLLSATLAAAMTTWTTFVPCFLWIFLGAPHIEQLRGNRRIEEALASVTAAVVGVVLNLAVWFATQTFRPAHVIDWFAVSLAAAAFVAVQWFKMSVVWLVVVSGLAGLATHWM
jgi:chromate transporter